jgi:hypothetical protein
MFGQRDEIRKRLYDVIERFRQKGATSPEKAMTAEELGLPPRFEEAMKRRLGRLGVFVEVGGKYYLSEERLKQIEEQRDKGGALGSRSNLFTLRIIRMIMAVLSVILLLVSVFVLSWELRLIATALIVVWIMLTLVQIYYLSKARREFGTAYR